MLSYIVFFSILIISLYLGCLVYYNNPKGKDNKIFLLLIIWLLFWLIVNYLENEAIPPNWRIIFFKADFLLAPILGYFWFLFCYNFLEEKHLSKLRNCLFILSVVVIDILIFSNLIINRIDAQKEAIEYNFGPLFPLYAFFILFFFVGGSVILFFKYRRLRGIKKMQTLYVLVGFLITSIIGATLNLFFQSILPIELFRFSTYIIIILISITSLAIIRHHLFDIRYIIQRGIIYSALLVIIISVYLVLTFVFGYFFQKFTNIAIIMAAGITTIIGIYGAPFIEKYFRRITDRIFFKDKYDYSKAIYELSEVLNKNINLEIVLKEISKKLKEILRIKNIRIILPRRGLIYDDQGNFRPSRERFPEEFIKNIEKDKSPILIHSEISYLRKEAKEREGFASYIKTLDQVEYLGKKYKIAITLPVFLENELIGLITLGDKLSGDLYTGEDINLLKTLSYQVAVALEKSQLYEKVKNYSRDLEEIVQKRTAKLMSLQEEQRQMMLEIAHGLQTPLTIIKGELSILEEQVKDKERVKILEKEIDRTSKFIYDMLRLAKLETDKDFKKEKINLSELIKELIESFEIITQEKNIKIISSIASKITILGVKSELEELITNLVSNSVKYMFDERVKKIIIKLIRKNDKIEISIEDTGIGISQQNLTHLFTRFYRVKDTKGATKRGTGLGLAICKRIAERHKGTIKAESKVGQGTKFTIQLPITED